MSLKMLSRCCLLLLQFTLLSLSWTAHADELDQERSLPNISGVVPSRNTPLDMSRFLGEWHVIARVPNPVERGHVGSSRDYVKDDNGDIRIHYRYRERLDGPIQEEQLRASPEKDSGNRYWRIWFYKVVPTRSEILEFDPDYQWLLVRYPGRGLAWILGKNPNMDQPTYHSLLMRLADHGIRTDRMRRVVHRRDQVNRLGFETL